MAMLYGIVTVVVGNGRRLSDVISSLPYHCRLGMPGEILVRELNNNITIHRIEATINWTWEHRMASENLKGGILKLSRRETRLENPWFSRRIMKLPEVSLELFFPH
jgi:hypothetical protein